MFYYFRKAAGFLTTVFLISVITFAVFQVLPGDPAAAILGLDADPVQLENLRASMNLEYSAPVRYFLWIKNLLKGDMGQSFRYQKSVNAIVFGAFTVTFQLSLLVLIITAAVGIPAGIWLAAHDKKKFSFPVSVLAQLGVSVPAFCAAVFFIVVFSVKLKIFPSMGYVPFSENPVACLKSLFLPSISLAFGSASILVRYMRSSVLAQLGKDYVRTARSKGMGERAVLVNHVLRNSLIPVITVLGMLVSEILGGSIIVENIFSLPGIGRMLASSIYSRDFPLIQGLALYLSVVVVLCNFFIDILYSIIDPRIRLRGSKA
ncbi:ABC transporter permease [Treponema parvum]|uniref:ABC transporter permease n=1 Tax=Treponema parvum TaxID=138851 RepID=A0A975EZP0_9SPIR|nr:ABC transporter permease [Treponema parvum]QTQ11900.1 ABC transporter permease [Treponema parvum]